MDCRVICTHPNDYSALIFPLRLLEVMTDHMAVMHAMACAREHL